MSTLKANGKGRVSIQENKKPGPCGPGLATTLSRSGGDNVDYEVLERQKNGKKKKKNQIGMPQK
jgi:hypothetical protein